MALEQMANQQKSFTDRLKERKDVANQYKQAYLKQLREAGQSDYKIGTTSMFGSLGPMQKALTGIVESAGEDTGLSQTDLKKLAISSGSMEIYQKEDGTLDVKPTGETTGKPLGSASASEAKLLGMASSGYESLNRLQEKFGKDKKASISDWLGLTGAKSGEDAFILKRFLGDITPWGRQTEQDLFNVADVILKLRTGAASNENEIKAYIEDKLRPLDPHATKKEALELMQKELDTVIKSMGYEPSQLQSGAEGVKAELLSDDEIDAIIN